MKVSYSKLNVLLRWELFQFLADILEYAESHEEGMPELLTTKVAELHTSFEAYDEALVQEAKETPVKLLDAEKKRDYLVRKIFNIATEYSDCSFDKEKEDAGKGVLHAFKPYGTGSEIARMSQDAQTAVLVNLLQDVKTTDLKLHLLTLGLMSGIEELELSNTDFQYEQRIRTKEQLQKLTGVVQSAREAAQAMFIELVKVINALAIVEGEEKYAEWKHTFNGIVKKYIDRAKLRSKKDGEENSDPTKE